MKKKLKSMLLGTAVFGALIVLPAVSSAEEWSWTLLKDISGGIVDYFQSDIDINKADPSRIYANVFPEGVFKSIDSGKNWNTVGFEGLSYGNVTTSPINPDVVFFTGYDPLSPDIRLWKSIDGGITWRGILATPRGGLGNVTFHPLDTTKMFADTQDWEGGILLSTDGGEHWFNPEYNYIYTKEYAFHPTDPNKIWVGYNRWYGGNDANGNYMGVAYSTNGGSTWSRVEFGRGYSLSSLVVDQKNPAILYAASPIGIWSGVDYTGVWKSTNGGLTWTKKNTGLINTYVVKLALNSTTGSLYAATLEGVFFSENGAESWTKISDSPESVNTIALSPDGTRLYVVTSNGIYLYTELVNQPPVANANGPYVGDEGSPITFDGSGSSDPDGTIVLYEWDLDGDGLYDDATGVNPSYTWGDDYSGSIGLKVTDNDGLSSTALTTVTVSNISPTVEAGSDQSVFVGDTVQFNGSFTDPGLSDTHAIEWDFGDGTTTSGTLTQTHVYSNKGTYTVTLTVTDDDGGIGNDILKVTVKPIPATIRIEPETLNLFSKGVFTAFITFSEGYNVANINFSTVVCEGAMAVKGIVSEEDKGTYIVKFNRQDLVNVPIGGAVTLTVTGKVGLADFEGKDMVNIMLTLRKEALPKDYVLYQNSPNPFNPITTIQYAIPAGNSEMVRLTIYDSRGSLVRTLVDGMQNPGIHTATWNATDDSGRRISSGIYIYWLEVGNFTQSRKMLFIR